MWIDFCYQSKRYRRSLDLDATKENIKLAKTKLIPELSYKLSTGVFFENKQKPLTVDEMAKISFEMHKNERRDFTHKSHINIYNNHIKKAFGAKVIKDIKPSELTIWQAKLLDCLAPKTVKNIRTIFNTILDDALKDEIIAKNPFSLIKSPKQYDVKDKNPFSIDEIFSILENANESMRAFFAIGFFTGMRTGEIIGLKLSDINLDERIIKIQRSRRQGIEDLPKTKNSIRDVEIIDVLMPHILKHLENTHDNQVYLFETYANKPFNTVAKIAVWYWKPLLEKLGIKYRNLYQMRHTFASMMISNGEDILWVSNMLGHKDSSMTLEKYARYVKRSDKKRAAFLSN